MSDLKRLLMEKVGIEVSTLDSQVWSGVLQAALGL